MDRPVTSEHGEEYIDSLYNQVIEAEEHSLEALQTLSNIAFGGHPLAQRLSGKIDKAILSGDLVLPSPLKSHISGGVPKEAWSPSDQKRMSEGKLPLSAPEHPNV